jgi:hypothetical protein
MMDAALFLNREGKSMLLSWPTFVVSRRINRSLPAVQSVLFDPSSFRPGDTYGVGTDGALTIDTPFRLIVAYPAPSWRATARLFARGPRAVAQVELEVAAWSDDASELTVRPIARHPERWSRRRLRRYFALAHDGADRGLEILTSDAPAGRARDTQAVRTDSVGSARVRSRS